MSEFITVSVDKSSEDRVLLRVSKVTPAVKVGLRKGITAGLIYLSSYIKEQLLSGQVLKNRTGNARRSIFYQLQGDSGIVGVGKEAPYLKFHERGVPHSWVITPTKAKALHFVINGRDVFARKVVHPGLKERSFMRRGLRESKDKIVDLIAVSVRKEANLEQVR